MKVDSRFYCFGCGASGDVIDFAALLHGLGKREAAVRLAEDFGVSYEKSGNAPPDMKRHNRSQSRQKSAEQRFQETERYCFRVLCDYLCLLEHWKTAYAPQPQDAIWHPLFVEALQRISYTEYLLDILLYGEIEEKAALIAAQGKEVLRLEQRISELAAGNAGSGQKDDGHNGTGADTGRNPGQLLPDRFLPLQCCDSVFRFDSVQNKSPCSIRSRGIPCLSLLNSQPLSPHTASGRCPSILLPHNW